MAHGKSDADIIQTTHNTARFFVENRHIAWVLLIAVSLWGLYGYQSMPQRKDPDIPVRMAVAITPWPGVSAEKIEQLVTKKIEEKMAENARVVKLESISRTNVSVVYVELDKRVTETGKEFDDIKLKLDSIRDLRGRASLAQGERVPHLPRTSSPRTSRRRRDSTQRLARRKRGRAEDALNLRGRRSRCRGPRRARRRPRARRGAPGSLSARSDFARPIRARAASPGVAGAVEEADRAGLEARACGGVCPPRTSSASPSVSEAFAAIARHPPRSRAASDVTIFTGVGGGAPGEVGLAVLGAVERHPGEGESHVAGHADGGTDGIVVGSPTVGVVRRCLDLEDVAPTGSGCGTDGNRLSHVHGLLCPRRNTLSRNRVHGSPWFLEGFRRRALSCRMARLGPCSLTGVRARRSSERRGAISDRTRRCVDVQRFWKWRRFP